MSPPAKKRKTDFISNEVATLKKPVLAGIKKSIFDQNGHPLKNPLPVFFIRDGGDWETGSYRFMVPFNNKGYYVGSRGNKDHLSIHALRNRCINHNRFKCKALCTLIPKNRNWFMLGSEEFDD